VTDLAAIRSSVDRTKQTLAKISVAAAEIVERHEAVRPAVRQIQLAFQTTTGSKIRGAVDRAHSKASRLALSIEHILVRCDRLIHKTQKLELDLSQFGRHSVTAKSKKLKLELHALQHNAVKIKSELEPLFEVSSGWANELEKFSVQAHWSYRVYLAIDRLRNGYDDVGLRDLLQLTYGPDTPSDHRRRALSELLSWAHTSNDLELMHMASSHMEAYRISPDRYSPSDRELVLRLEGVRQIESPQSSSVFLALLDAHRRSSEDSLLAAANLAAHLKLNSVPDLGANLQLAWINAALALKELEPVFLNPALGSTPFDQLDCTLEEPIEVLSPLMVTVIVPAFNSEAWLPTAMRGLLAQSWRNLEIIIVDDCSTDATLAVARKIAKQDQRVTVLENLKNQGAYASRNKALEVAKGHYVTVHDADDWSHPRKIERQLLAFDSNMKMVANMSRSVRIDPSSLKFFAQYGREILRQNSSSLMFKRNPVLTELGFWDEVKFGADTEYHHRINAKYGMGSAPTINEGLLSFTRFHSESLTGGGKNSTLRGIIGARRDYVRKFTDWHEQMKFTDRGLYLERATTKRPFVIPTSSSSSKAGEVYDLILVANLAPQSEWLDVVYRKLKALAKSGQKIAVVHLPSVDRPNAQPSEKLEVLLSKSVVTRLDREHSARAISIVFHIDTLRERNELMPKLRAQSATIVLTDLASPKQVSAAQKLVREYVGKRPTLAAESKSSLKALAAGEVAVTKIWEVS
jgi:glycosyltransferase involved in cell wall biosynthesis